MTENEIIRFWGISIEKANAITWRNTPSDAYFGISYYLPSSYFFMWKDPKKALLLALRIWSRQKWSFEWISEKIPLRRQEQFFTEYRNIYDSTCSTDLNNIVTLTDHHIGNFWVPLFEVASPL